MADELVDIYDENYNHQGTMLKSEARKKGHWITSIHTWIIRPQNGGFVLFQKRGAKKKIYPNTLDISAAGHYQAGEAVSEGVREIKEEMGISVSFNELIPLGIRLDIAKLGENYIREFCHTFLLEKNLKPSEYNLDLNEVEGLVEVSISDGLDLFSGKSDKVLSTGVEYASEVGGWNEIQLYLTKESFIPRIDHYYYKIFMLADRYLKGDKHLAI